MIIDALAFEDLDPRTAYAVWRLRQQVFVLEQQCLYDDLDGRDLEPATRHVVMSEAGEVVATRGCSTTGTCSASAAWCWPPTREVAAGRTR